MAVYRISESLYGFGTFSFINLFRVSDRSDTDTTASQKIAEKQRQFLPYTSLYPP